MLVLFAYAFLSNVALAVVPHEPVVIWYGRQIGVWPTALIATAGTVGASWFDHRAFSRLIARLAGRSGRSPAWVDWVRARFRRAPFAIIALSGMSPLPFFPFKALAFAEHYPMAPYLGAVALGRLPRYLLLAWIGHLFSVPSWVFVTLALLLCVPTLRRLLWQPRNGN